MHTGLWLLALSVVTISCFSGEQPRSIENQAQELDKLLMCPACPGETIDQSQVELANQMQAIVREKLGRGESRDHILEFFVDRYGPGVLAEPPRQGFNLLIWLTPPITVLVAILVLGLFVRRITKGTTELTRPTLQTQTDLEPFLFQVDQETGSQPQSLHPKNRAGTKSKKGNNG